MPSITNLKVPKQSKALFDRFYEVDSYSGELKVPEEMKPWVRKQFSSVQKVSKQKIIRITNKLTFESTLFNELRAQRPMVQGNQDWKQEIKESVGDPFCQPEKLTPSDTFGRIKGKHSTTASNVAKYDKWHGLVIFNDHNPLNFTQEKVTDYLETANKWIAKAHKDDKKAIYPFLLWNCLWKSSASIIHGHMQVLLARKNHYSGIQYLNKIRQEYLANYGTDYFEDLFKIHKDLGLGTKLNNQKVIAHITPRKEKEILIIGESSKAVYRCLKAYRNLNVESFNLAITTPPVQPTKGWEGFPVIARLVDRGSLSQKTSDIGGMELYAGTSVVSADPYNVIKALK